MYTFYVKSGEVANGEECFILRLCYHHAELLVARSPSPKVGA